MSCHKENLIDLHSNPTLIFIFAIILSTFKPINFNHLSNQLKHLGGVNNSGKSTQKKKISIPADKNILPSFDGAFKKRH